jgi:hypothetical protein
MGACIFNASAIFVSGADDELILPVHTFTATHE